MRAGRLTYRVGQFVRALTVRPRFQEREEIQGLLSPGQSRLFHGMKRAAQRHGLVVYRKLRRQGTQEQELLAAALLHDVGKGHLTLAHRVAAVVLEGVWPALLEGLASPGGPSWRRGFYDHLHHEDLGAERARRAGSSPLSVDLIRYHHQDGGQGPAGLMALRAADEGA